MSTHICPHCRDSCTCSMQDGICHCLCEMERSKCSCEDCERDADSAICDCGDVDCPGGIYCINRDDPITGISQ